MADDKKKTGKEDDNLISFRQKYEVDYAVSQLSKQFPGKSKKELRDALINAARKINPSEGRDKIMTVAAKKLKR